MMTTLSTCDLPYELLFEISSYLTWADLAAWVRTSREHEACLSPILYQWLEPYDYRPITYDDDGAFKTLRRGNEGASVVIPRSRIIIWAASLNLIGTIKKVSAIEDLTPFINHPVLKNGRGTKPGSFGITPLHQAALCGQAWVLDFLVGWGADVNATVAGRLRPVHLAGSDAVVESLVSHGSSPHPSGAFSIPPLSHAVSTNPASSAIKCLLDLGCDPNTDTLVGISAGEAAVRNGSDDILEMLLKAGLDVSDAAPRGGSLIYKAIFYLQRRLPDKAARIVKLLLEHGAPAHGGIIMVDGPWQMHLLQTNLYLAASLPDSSAVVQLLLDHGADSNVKSWFQQGPLDVGREGVICVEPESPIKRLILDAASASEAVADSKIETISILAKHGARFEQLHGESTLLNHLLSIRPLCPGLVKIVTFLVLPDTCLTADEAKNSIRTRFLRNTGPVHTLLSNPAWFSRGRYASQAASYRIFELLLSLGADYNEVDREGIAPLILACRLPEEVNGLKVIKSLKAHGADMNVVSERGLNALHTIIEDYCIVTSECANRFQAVLMTDVGGNIDVDARDPHGMTALATLAHMRPKPPRRHDLERYPIDIKTRMMVMLLRCGADIHAKQKSRPDEGVSFEPGLDESPLPGGTPLHYACHNRYPDIVELLLRKGASEDINSFTDNGYTPLMVLVIAAAEKLLGWNELVTIGRMLLDAGADPKIRNVQGKTAWDIWVDKSSEPDKFGHFGGAIYGDFNVRVSENAIREICGMTRLLEYSDQQ
ncbi:Fc.00g070870.m01.CDS01 [Cosmosporella sp. VM-42]